MNPFLRILVSLLLALPASRSLAFQAPEIRVGLSAEEIFAGESVDYTVEIRNTENPAAPDMSALRDLFEVVATGDQSRNQSSTTIINGRVSQSTYLSHVYQFRLTSKQPGELQIPAPTATVDGKPLTGRKLSLRVIVPEPQDLVLVEMNSSHLKVYPTQPFTVNLTILVQPLPDNASNDPLRPLRRQPPHIEVNWIDTPDHLSAGDKYQWLQPLLSRDSTGFTLNDVSASSGSFFFGESRAAMLDLSKGRETRNSPDGTPRDYFKYELSRTFTAETFGRIPLGPAVVKGAFVSEIGRDGYRAKKVVATAPAIEIEVREVPLPRPPNYCGGIGDFTVDAIARPTKLRVGDPITLTVRLQRAGDSGSLDLISAPDLSSNEQLAADFELIDKDPTGRVDGVTKEFSYVVRPKRADVSIPALSIATFDPLAEAFKQIGTAPIALEVSEAVGLNSVDLIGSVSSSTSGLKSRSEGIFQNITDPAALRDERVGWVAWSELVAGAWAVAGATSAVVLLRRRHASDGGLQRRQLAKRNANKRLGAARSALSRGDSKLAMREVRSAVIGLIADARNRVSEGLTATDVEQVLAAANVTEVDRSAIKKLLESIDAHEYGAGLPTDPKSAIDEASAWLRRVAPLLEHGA